VAQGEKHVEKRDPDGIYIGRMKALLGSVLIDHVELTKGPRGGTVKTGAGAAAFAQARDFTADTPRARYDKTPVKVGGLDLDPHTALHRVLRARIMRRRAGLRARARGLASTS
jgi:hypothetical protein